MSIKEPSEKRLSFNNDTVEKHLSDADKIDPEFGEIIDGMTRVYKEKISNNYPIDLEAARSVFDRGGGWKESNVL